MKNVPPFCFPRADRGAALVLVLCFVVLLTGLTVAYFSRAMVGRQSSNASTSTVQAETVANSAVDVIVGDLKQEIASGAATPIPGGTPGAVYLPKRASYAVPQRNTSPAATATGGPLPNLVRRSARSDSTSGNANYVPAPALTSRASATGSAVRGANGRFVSPARWNRHYLLPTNVPAGSSAATDASTPVAEFTAPDWVFVTAEKGPCVLSTPSKDAGGSTVSVTGRYAYAIYDEGGLLDINHTGYPSTSTLAHIGAKPAPSYADLTQLGLSSANVDNLLGWRHYATLQATGSFPGLQPSSSQADAAYHRLFLSNPANLLQVSPTVWNGKTDQIFLSRQQLINYLAAAGLDPKYLQYLGTFSRSLNQPSYAPEVTRPPVLGLAAGGNDATGNDKINPSFLTVAVRTAFSRPDGTRKALVDEPLVKQRFALNRLAWLTYQGPSAERNAGEADMAALINSYGVTVDFLKQGTRQNIEYYFGLRWGNPEPGWNYVHGNNALILNVSNPARPSVVGLTGSEAREPDFFELLKASINPGALAKPSISPAVQTTDQSIARAAQSQYKTDKSLDAAILQIGANIIDQFDTDSFPTRISYNLASIDRSGAVYGIENLPYVSRVRAGLIRLVDADPPVTDPDGGSQPVKNTGVAALMNYPELWNPHDWSSTNPAQSFGTIGPRRFKVYATTYTNNGIQQATTVYSWSTDYRNSCDADQDPTKSPGFQSVYGLPFGTFGSGKGGDTRVLKEANTVMTFTVDPNAGGGTLFREPTVLFTRGSPSGSNLDSPALVNSNAELGAFATPKTQGFFAGSGGGLLSAVQTGRTDLIGPKKATPYVGFYIGSHPLRWAVKDPKNPTPLSNAYAYQTWYGPVNDVTYTLACEDGSGGWIPYDMKALTSNGGPDADLNLSVDSGFGLAGIVDDNGHGIDYGVRFYESVDPRASRFGMLDSYINNNKTSISPRGTASASPFPAEQAQGIYKSNRDGTHAGTALWFVPASDTSNWFSATMGWYHDSDYVINNAFRPGLLTQNNPAVTPDGIVSSTGSLPSNTNIAGTTFAPFYYADADGVVRRASGGNVPGDTGGPASTSMGLPMAYATATYDPAYSSGSRTRQIDSRPVILNRPFRSVAELGYVYSGTPWKNLDFVLPESGNAALLDVFCISDDSDANAMTAGRVNLNTRQIPVLQAILAQTNKDLWNDGSTSTALVPANATILSTASSTQAQQIAQLLVGRTAMGPTSGPNANQGPQPLQNLSDLVGRWVKQVDLPAKTGSNAAGTAGIDGQASCDGFTADLANAFASPDPTHNIQRFGEGAIRALTNAGQTRVWNLMFDIVAQTGRYPVQATTLDQFNVEGEQHWWVHVAIDRCTGQVIDKQVEIVTE